MNANVSTVVCPCCGHAARRYRVAFSRLHVRLARLVFQHCVSHGVHEFKKHDLKLTNTEYVNLAFLQRFGLIYHVKDANGKILRGTWGAPVRRLAQFFRNEWRVAKWTWRDVDSKGNESSEERILLSEVPKSERVLDPETMRPVFLQYETSINLWHE